MKLRLSLFALVFPLLALGLASARAANPLKSLGSSLKKAGQVLTPWKTPSPAPFTQPSSPAKPAAYPARPAPQTPAARPIAAKPIAAKPIAARPIAKPFAPQLATAKPAPAKPTAKPTAKLAAKPTAKLAAAKPASQLAAAKPLAKTAKMSPLPKAKAAPAAVAKAPKASPSALAKAPKKESPSAPPRAIPVPENLAPEATSIPVSAQGSDLAPSPAPLEDLAFPEDLAPPEDQAPLEAILPPPVPPVSLADLPFGTPVMGRKGCVRSPYAADDGMVDVAGIPAGSKVKCPFTGKTFRVP